MDFNYVGYFDSPVTAATGGSDINISLSSALFASSNTLARAIFPNASENIQAYPGAAGDIYLNPNSEVNSYPSYAAGTQGWFVLLHEIGHSLGPKHPHDDGGAGRPTLGDIGLSGLNLDWARIMSCEEGYSYNLLQFDPATPMFLDVIGLQYLYGQNRSSNAGDGVYTLTKTGEYLTLWDPSGNDAVDARGNSEGWHIYLDISDDSSAGFAMPSNELILTPGRVDNPKGITSNLLHHFVRLLFNHYNFCFDRKKSKIRPP